MVVIRLSRGGAKKRPFYHVVVANKVESRDGRFIERIGYYNPIAIKASDRLSLNLDRIKYWITCGAQASERVRHLIKLQEKATQDTAAAA